MSSIQIDRGYLIINAYVDTTDGTYDITFDMEKEAEEAMDLLTEALCGRWLDEDSAELLS